MANNKPVGERVIVRRSRERELAYAEAMPFDRQRDESSQAFQYFTVYRDTPPPRKLSVVQAAILASTGRRVTTGTLSKYSGQFLWIERVKAWEQYNDRVLQKKLVDKAREAREHQALGANIARGAATTVISSLVNEWSRRLQMQAKDPVNANFLEALDPADLNTMLQVAARTLGIANAEERLALGMATEITESTSRSLNVNATFGKEAPAESMEQLKEKLERLGFALKPEPAALPPPEATEGEFTDSDAGEERPEVKAEIGKALPES